MTSRLIVFLLAAPCVVHSQRQLLVYTIPEEQDVGTEVGNIAEDSEIDLQLGQEEFDGLRWSMLQQDPRFNLVLFSIDQSSGVLRTADRIDRDALCTYNLKCRLEIMVLAQTESGQGFYTINVKVDVMDVNDHAPVFPQSDLVVMISEDTVEQTSIPILTATDVDIENNTIHGYSLRTPR